MNEIDKLKKDAGILNEGLYDNVQKYDALKALKQIESLVDRSDMDEDTSTRILMHLNHAKQSIEKIGT